MLNFLYNDYVGHPPETYAYAEGLPAYDPRSVAAEGTASLPQQLSVANAHKDRPPSSYDIGVCEITYVRHAMDNNTSGEDMGSDSVMLGAEERPQWDEGVREKMIQILQLSDGQTRRSFEDLRKIANDKAETTDLLLYHHLSKKKAGEGRYEEDETDVDEDLEDDTALEV